MKYCIKCGTQLEDDVVTCTNCGFDGGVKIKQEKKNKRMKVAALYVMLGVNILFIECIIFGLVFSYGFNRQPEIAIGGVLFLVGMQILWAIPTMIGCYLWIKKDKPLSKVFKVFVLITVSRIAGILLLCSKENTKQNTQTKKHKPKIIILKVCAVVGMVMYLFGFSFITIHSIYSDYKTYNNAIELMESGVFYHAEGVFVSIPLYKRSKELIKKCENFIDIKEFSEKYPESYALTIDMLVNSDVTVRMRYFSSERRIGVEDIVINSSGITGTTIRTYYDLFPGFIIKNIEYDIDVENNHYEWILYMGK